MLRPYRDQSHIPDFEHLDRSDRRHQVLEYRQDHLTRLGAARAHNRLRRARNEYKHTKPYVHLTLAERRRAVQDVADTVASWSYA